MSICSGRTVVGGRSLPKVTLTESVRAVFAESANPDTGVRSHSAEKAVAWEETPREPSKSGSFQSDIKFVFNPVMLKLLQLQLHECRLATGFRLFACSVGCGDLQMLTLPSCTADTQAPRCIPAHMQIKTPLLLVCETSSLNSKLPNYVSTSH